MTRLLPCVFLAACGAPDASSTADTVAAIVDPDRSSHFFDMPFPDAGLLDDSGHADLSGFPVAPSELTQGITNGWARRIGMTSQGFANNGAAYFRFESALDVAPVMTGAKDDPILLIDTETGERIPLTVRFTESAAGDPFMADNLLAFAPALGHPPRSGATLAAVVMESAGVHAAKGWTASAEIEAALQLAGVKGKAAVATVFTIQDATGELKALFADVDERLGDVPDWGSITWKRITHLDFAQGLTDSGEEATVVTTTFEDDSQEVVNMYAHEEAVHSHAMLDDWPMAVYQAEIPVLNYSGLADRPYMSPGFGHLFDTNVETGWIDFTDGAPAHSPDTESMRIILSLPKNADGTPIHDAPIAMYDHGTGGAAINAVSRINKNDDGHAMASRWNTAGWAVIGRDAALYGRRFDLIDAGFSGGSLGFYNVVNLPAFRDNQRQTAVDGHVLLRFIQDGLNASLPAGSVDASRIRRIGHSLGSVTANLGVSAEPEAFESVFLSGTGGVLSHYFLDTGLLEDFGNDLVDQIFTLFQVDPPEPVTAPAVLGAALGIPEAGWAKIDRLHPAMTLFQWTMDPGDPMSVARDETLPATVLIGIDDHQVPNFTSYGLATALPDVRIVTVEAGGDYDPHVVLHREVAGLDALSAWLSE
jgi:hypothetical protein